MRIAVFVRPVQNPAVPVEPGPTGAVEDLPGYAPIPNPMDELALEAAFRLREAAPFRIPVLACSVGGNASRIVLREFLACGADDAVWIEEPAWEPDGGVVAQRLKDFHRAEPFELALFGMRDLDTGAGQVGPMFAALAGMDYVDSVVRAEWREAGRLVVTRRQKRVREEILVRLPACLGVLRGAPLRYPSFWGKLKADMHRLRNVPSGGVPVVRRVERKKFARSKPRKGSVAAEYAQSRSVDRMRQALGLSVTEGKDKKEPLLTGDAAETAEKILEILAEEKIVNRDSLSPKDG
jgi:electron transfer flavoprotein alpha/beta subunit